MPRVFRVGAAQMGPLQRADGREVAVARMLELLDQPKKKVAISWSFPSLR